MVHELKNVPLSPNWKPIIGGNGYRHIAARNGGATAFYTPDNVVFTKNDPTSYVAYCNKLESSKYELPMDPKYGELPGESMTISFLCAFH